MNYVIQKYMYLLVFNYGYLLQPLWYVAHFPVCYHNI